MSKSKTDIPENALPAFTALFPITRQNVENFRENLKKHKLEPWLFLYSCGVKVTDFYGKTTHIKGVEYAGTVVDVFWKFIEPFLRDGMVRILNETLEMCVKRNWKPERYIKEAAGLLKGYLIWPTYDYMASIDQKLSTRAQKDQIVKKDSEYTVLVHRLDGPKIVKRNEPISTIVKGTVKLKDTSYETGQMEKFLTEQVNLILQGLAQEPKPTEASGKDDDAYISYTKAIELSNGILTRKKLDKAIKQGDPVTVRDKKPSKNRRSVHIQDILLLVGKLSANDKAAEQAARMFGEYKKQFQKKTTGQVNLD